MLRGNLPPQAYTREVVANAYNWLQGQPENIRKMAQNTDTLVALYLRAKRNGEVNGDAEPTAGVESFRNQLKSLATEIQQFVPEQERAHPLPLHTQEVVQTVTASPPQTAMSKNHGDLSLLDPHSLEILKKVRQHLNLSSDVEALRMLLVLGFEKVQGLFK